MLERVFYLSCAFCFFVVDGYEQGITKFDGVWFFVYKRVSVVKNTFGLDFVLSEIAIYWNCHIIIILSQSDHIIISLQYAYSILQYYD